MAKQLIAIRLSPRLLSQLRKMAAKQGKPYQSLIHELLKGRQQSRLGHELVSLVHLVCLVYLVCLVCLVGWTGNPTR